MNSLEIVILGAAVAGLAFTFWKVFVSEKAASVPVNPQITDAVTAKKPKAPKAAAPKAAKPKAPKKPAAPKAAGKKTSTKKK